jgi:hypothetical protein
MTAEFGAEEVATDNGKKWPQNLVQEICAVRGEPPQRAAAELFSNL